MTANEKACFLCESQNANYTLLTGTEIQLNICHSCQRKFGIKDSVTEQDKPSTDLECKLCLQLATIPNLMSTGL